MAPNPFRSYRETRRRAREAVDVEKAETVFAAAVDEDVEPETEATAALREAAAEQIADVAESAARRARRRGRKDITPRDVGLANERYLDPEEREQRR